jgi:hypothetical protein
MIKRKKNLTPDEQLDTLEAQLAGTLRPVQPPKAILQRLRDRIQLPDRSEILMRLRDWRRLMMVFGGVMSGMVALITIARAVFHLVGRRHTG